MDWSSVKPAPHSKRKDIPTYPTPHGRRAKESLLYYTVFFNSQTVIFWRSMSIIPILQMGTSRFREVKQCKQPYSKAWAPNHCPQDSLPGISDAFLYSGCSPKPPPAQTPGPFFPHLFLLVYLLWIPFCPGSSQWYFHLHPTSHLHQLWGPGWKFQGRQPSRFDQSLMSATFGLFMVF